MKNRDIKSQELASRLVQREVYYCVSSLMYGIAKIMWECRGFSEAFEDPEEISSLYQQDDWETPGDWFIMENADLDDLEKIANEYGDFAELLKEFRVPDEIPLPTHWVCDDCQMALVNGDYTGIDYDRTPDNEAEIEARHRAVREGVEEFPGDAHPLSESEEFANYRCDCCGTTLAGRRHAFSDSTDTSDDLGDRIKWAIENGVDGDNLMRNLRRAVSDLVGEQDGGWEWVGREFNLDPETHEVYEHWIVSDWLAERLKEEGYVVGEFAGLTIWGRCTTGQSISLDYIIQKIAAELWAEELAEVKEDEE